MPGMFRRRIGQIINRVKILRNFFLLISRKNFASVKFFATIASINGFICVFNHFWFFFHCESYSIVE